MSHFFLKVLKSKEKSENYFIFISGSQELHVSAPTNPAFSKFNSLDRRALNKRQNSNGLLKIATSGPDSLPVRPLVKEPERRHSSYDPKSRPIGAQVKQPGASAAININGLPDPFSNKIYSSQESINRSTNNGTPLRPNSSTGNYEYFEYWLASAKVKRTRKWRGSLSKMTFRFYGLSIYTILALISSIYAPIFLFRIRINFVPN